MRKVKKCSTFTPDASASGLKADKVVANIKRPKLIFTQVILSSPH